ncbi:hypothetical protein ACFQRC_08640 [Enterovirga sp. GCM10030262]|uniref:hypothetical protein n=1 Tax=Enterovirga sp. GCM10030262 TaxID=3273391 RepID=UPI00360F0F38
MIIGLAASSGACVSGMSTRSTSAIYEEALMIGFVSSRCGAADTFELHLRLEPLKPWLEGEIGREQVLETQDRIEDNRSSIRFISCPTDEERRSAKRALEKLVGELENRAKLQ